MSMLFTPRTRNEFVQGRSCQYGSVRFPVSQGYAGNVVGARGRWRTSTHSMPRRLGEVSRVNQVIGRQILRQDAFSPVFTRWVFSQQGRRRS